MVARRYAGLIRACRLRSALDCQDLQQEIFGPVLHIVRWSGDPLAVIVADQRAGLWPDAGHPDPHRQPRAGMARAARVGNVYVNRNMIGAVVGVQPFGGEGLSAPAPRPAGRTT
jgi:RHH-type proline utilization regulon transcriptional repressor/proline dehydrogenase/delta 1-pyrroline-5-carboxylate dehydrogenase